MDFQDISFGGIEDIIGCEFTLSRGVSPSVCTLFIRPQSSLNISRGSLRIAYGSSEIVFPDMTPDVAHIRREPTKWALQLYDRRFYWKQGTIGGTYNARLPDCSLLTQTQYSARAMADALLRVLGETTHDVSKMSNLVYPYAKWEGTNPAYALANLLDQCSCCLCPDQNNKLVVYPLGQGAELPDSDDIAAHIPYKLAVPSKLTCICGPDVFQSKLALEAVTVGTDSYIKPIDVTDYKPSAWGTDFYMFFPNVSSSNRSYAFNSMYRYFRPTGQAQGGFAPPGCNDPVVSVSQYALNDTTVTPIIDTDGFKRSSGAYLDGTFWPQSDHAANTGANTVYTGKFTINKEAGIVVTDYPVIKWSSANAIQEPTLYLTTSYSVWNQGLTDKIRYTKERNIGGVGDYIIRKPELFRAFKTDYSYTSPIGTQSNQTDIDAEVDEYLNLHALKFNDPWIEDREYHGILPIQLDGKIAQVRWRIGYDGPTTRASKNFEFDTFNVGADERRRRESVSQLQEAYR